MKSQILTGRLNWLLSFVDHARGSCLRFIDPYGETVFNRAQIGELRKELTELQPRITDAALEKSKHEYLDRLGPVTTTVKIEAIQYVESISTADLLAHLTKVLSLVAKAESLGPHHYVRFVGD